LHGCDKVFCENEKTYENKQNNIAERSRMQKTYQDLLEVGEREEDRMEFVQMLIRSRGDDPQYNIAKIADQYDRHKNVTITQYQKILYTVTGKAIPDNYSANYKLASRFFNRFVVQENQYLLGNGVTWENSATVEKLGDDFDNKVQKLGKDALVCGTSFGFWNFDHLEAFNYLEFIPLYDEENGSLSAGVRYWQINPQKPLRATLYEQDGYTEYIWRNGQGEMLNEKRKYITRYVRTEADGTIIYDGENYPGFPIVPMFGNPHHQSELVGLQEQIDCYDLIKSGFANTVDEASYIYWAIQNAGGMDDIDLANFVERMKTVHAGLVEDYNARAEAHTIEAPYASREALLDRLRSDLYEDAMALDTKAIQGGAITATQIKSSYDDLDKKTDEFEGCVTEFVDGILALAGIDDEPTFTRSRIVNVTEEIQTIVSAGTYLESSYVTEKILTLLGDADKAEDMIKQMDADNIRPLGEENGEEDNV
jgi:SPP1 family phage portal protein